MNEEAGTSDAVISKIKNLRLGVIIMCLLMCLVAMMISIILTYHISLKYSRPFSQLVEILSNFNNQTLHKRDFMKDIISQLNHISDNIKGQSQELIDSFVNLLEHILDSNVLDQPSEREKKFDYPLNQYNTQFINNAKKGQTEINWQNVLNYVEDDPKFVF